MKPPASYYGGKARMAAWIVSLMGPHRRYIEPFCGTARGRRWWVRVVQGFNSKPGDRRNGWSVSAAQGASGARTAVSLVDRFADVAERLRMVAIENSPAVEVIRHFDDPTAVIYCDPPYLGTTRTARSRREREESNAYTHELLKPEEHRELAGALREAKGHVLLSGYDSPLYAELYDGWWRVETSMARVAAFHTGDEATRRRSIEVIWSNRPLNTQQLDFEMETA